MAVQNSLATRNNEKKVPFSVAISSVGYKKLISSTLGDPKKAERFVAAITSAVATTPALQECEVSSIVSGALLGETLNLSPSPQLGNYYLVPFKNKNAGTTNAQFVLGVKGYKQLAIRSGQYKKINAMEIKEGELIRYNPFDDEIELQYIEDEDLRDSLPTIGYYAMFELHNGFKKVLYWSKEKMICHADKFSAAFSKEATKGRYPKVSYEDFCAGNYDKKDAWLYSSFWYQNFDEMGVKTMMRQLLSKWGILSIEMEKAFSADGGVISTSGEVDYVDAPDATPQPETVQAKAEIVQEAPQQPDPIPEPPLPEEPPFVDDDEFASLMS